MAADTRFVLIVGTQSSGTSAIAGVAYHVGLWLGKDLGGRYGSDPDHRCGFEDRTVSHLVRSHVRFLAPRIKRRHKLKGALAERIRQLQAAAARRGVPAGVKLPRLSRTAEVFQDLCGDSLRVIACERPLADAIASMQRRSPRKAAKWPTIQQWLWDGKEALVAAMPPEHSLRVEYYAVLKDPLAEAQKIAAFLSLAPTRRQLEKAVAIVHPKMKHVGG